MSRPPTTTNPRKITKLPVGDLRNDISFMSLRNNQLRVALHAHNDDAEDVLCAQVRASARRASCDSEESRCRGFRRNDPRRIHYGRVIDMLADADGQTLRLVEDFGSAFVFKPELEDHSVLRVEAEDLLHDHLEVAVIADVAWFGMLDLLHGIGILHLDQLIALCPGETAYQYLRSHSLPDRVSEG